VVYFLSITVDIVSLISLFFSHFGLLDNRDHLGEHFEEALLVRGGVFVRIDEALEEALVSGRFTIVNFLVLKLFLQLVRHPFISLGMGLRDLLVDLSIRFSEAAAFREKFFVR